MQALFSQTDQTLFGVPARKKLHHLVKKACGRDVCQKPRHLRNRLFGRGFHRKAQLCGNTHRTHHAHGVFTVALFGVPDHSEALSLQIFPAVVVVKHVALHGIVVKGVYRKVAARSVFPHFAENVVTYHPPLSIFSDAVGVQGSESRALNDFLTENDVHKAKALTDDEGAPLNALYLLRCGVGCHVKIFGSCAQQEVTDGSTHDIRLKAPVLQEFTGALRAEGHKFRVNAVLGGGNHARGLAERSVRPAQKVGHHTTDTIKHDGKPPDITVRPWRES